MKPDPGVIKLFSCSTQLSTKFQLLIKAKLSSTEEVPCSKSLRCCIYSANNCKNANNCWHFNINEHDGKSYITSGCAIFELFLSLFNPVLRGAFILIVTLGFCNEHYETYSYFIHFNVWMCSLFDRNAGSSLEIQSLNADEYTFWAHPVDTEKWHCQWHLCSYARAY